MRTPDEIKEGLYCCYIHPNERKCGECPYIIDDVNDCDCSPGKDAYDYIKQLERRICELTGKVAQLEAAQPKWISVEERMPEREVLAANFAPRTYGYKEYIIGYVSRGKCTEPGKCYAENDFEILFDVTHWMPLPDAPEVNA